MAGAERRSTTPDGPLALLAQLGARLAEQRAMVQSARSLLATYLAAPGEDSRTDRQVLHAVQAILDEQPPVPGMHGRGRRSG